jgi:hypothetical protein
MAALISRPSNGSTHLPLFRSMFGHHDAVLDGIPTLSVRRRHAEPL